MRTKRRAREVGEPEAPAIARADHAKDRALSDAGAPKAWRRLTVLELAYERGQLDDGEGDVRERAFRAKGRFDAGTAYMKLFLVAQVSGKDSTNIDRVMSVSTRVALTERQADAIRALVMIESRMGARDARIVRMVCGGNYRLSEAVLSACGTGYRHSVIVRFREALDALLDALETMRNSGRGHVSRET